MAKNGSDGEKAGQEDKSKNEEAAAPWDAIPEALRDAGRRATDLAQNPYARSLLAAGLVTAAAALAANKNVRDATRRNLKDASDAAEVAADNAGKVGAAIINAATEAVQRMLNLASTGGGEAAEAAAPSTPAAEPARKRTTTPAAATAPASRPPADRRARVAARRAPGLAPRAGPARRHPKGTARPPGKEKPPLRLGAGAN
jgi:hypothetical protein